MQNNKFFSENWIVLFGFVLILITFFKHEQEVKNVNKKLVPLISTKIQKINNSNLDSANERVPATQASMDDSDESSLKSDHFNSSLKFKKAVGAKNTHSDENNNSEVKSLIQHNLFKNSSWKLWPKKIVVKKSDLSEDQKNYAFVSNLAIVDSEADPDFSEFDYSTKAVVFDERLKISGVVTGVLVVKSKDKMRLKEDLKNWQAVITEEFDSIQTYFVSSQDKIFDLQSLYEKISSLEYVDSVELEVISRGYNRN